MSFIKFVCYKLIPITLLLCFIAFGLGVIFGNDTTYLQTTNVGNIRMYIFNLNDYVKDLATNRWEKLAEHYNFFEDAQNGLQTWWTNYVNNVMHGNWSIWDTFSIFGEFLKSWVGLLKAILNTIFIIPIQIVVIILQYIFTLIGFNLNAPSNYLGLVLQWIQVTLWL